MKNAKKTVSLLVLGLVGLLPTSAFATRVTVTGQAAETAGDKGATLEAVKRDARRKAVEQGAGVLVQSNTIVRNYQMVSDEIATSSTGVITNEQFGSLKVKDGVAEINLTADVSQEAVEEAICTVIKANHNPRIAFMFVERRLEGKESFSTVGTAQRGTIEGLLADALVSNCFTLVETGVKVTKLAADGDIPQEMIDAAIKNADAQYLLVGTGTITRGESSLSAKVITYGFNTTLKLINLDTKQITSVVNTSMQMSGLLNLSNALKQNIAAEDMKSTDYAKRIPSRKGDRVLNKDIFVNRIMGKLFTDVSKSWTSALVNKSRVIVEIKNVQKFKHLNAFKKVATATFKGAVIENPKLRNGKATMTIDGIDGGADKLAEGLEGKKVAGLTVEVSEVSGGKIVLELTK